MNDTIARDPRKDILALMKLLADEKHESESLADELAETKRDRHRWADRCHALESQMRGRTFQTPDEKDVRIGELEAALKDISVWQRDLADAKKVAAWALGCTKEIK